jgi:PAS domain-containing protein
VSRDFVEWAVVPHEVEMILMKQVASYLAMPIFLVDVDGNLLFYNEPAEQLLGCRYDETGELPLDEWGTMFAPFDSRGEPIPPDSLPLGIAVRQRRPAHGSFSMRGMDGVSHDISVTAFPLVGQHDRALGAVAVFWEEEVAS